MSSFYPAHIALALFLFVGLLLLLVFFAVAMEGGWRRVGHIYHEHFSQRHRERQLVAAVAFYLTFATVHLLTHSISAGRGPFHNLTLGGRHIHHLVWNPPTPPFRVVGPIELLRFSLRPDRVLSQEGINSCSKNSCSL